MLVQQPQYIIQQQPQYETSFSSNYGQDHYFGQQGQVTGVVRLAPKPNASNQLPSQSISAGSGQYASHVSAPPTYTLTYMPQASGNIDYTLSAGLQAVNMGQHGNTLQAIEVMAPTDQGGMDVLQQ